MSEDQHLSRRTDTLLRSSQTPTTRSSGARMPQSQPTRGSRNAVSSRCPKVTPKQRVHHRPEARRSSPDRQEDPAATIQQQGHDASAGGMDRTCAAADDRHVRSFRLSIRK